MSFPDAEHVVIAEEKIRDYLLNLSHPVGGPKAVWFCLGSAGNGISRVRC